MHEETLPSTKEGSVHRSTAGDEMAGGRKMSAKKEKAARKRAERLQRLVEAMDNLRSTSRDVTRSYQSNLEASIESIASHLRTQQESTDKKGKLKARTLKQMVALLEGLSVKPDRGRRKDLKQIERTVGALLRAVQKNEGK